MWEVFAAMWERLRHSPRGGSGRAPERPVAAGPAPSRTAAPTDPTGSTAQLTERLAGGDVTALAGLYDRFGRRGYALALDLCDSREQAERVVRDAFVGLWVDPARAERRPDLVGAALLQTIWITSARSAPEGGRLPLVRPPTSEGRAD